MKQNMENEATPRNRIPIADGDDRFHIHPSYDTSGVISEDATGTLYRSRNIIDDHPVAIKLFTQDVAPVREHLGEDNLSLTNIITVNEVHTANNGCPFAVMDLPGGICLDRILRKQDTLVLSMAINIALNVSLIIRALHVCEKAHGHVNAHNIFLRRQPGGQLDVKLLYHEIEGRPFHFNSPEFLSPELVTENNDLRPSDDNWAIVILLYQMIFGVLPFCGDTRSDITMGILTRAIVLPELFERRYPQISSFLYRGLARMPRDRFNSGKEMNLELKTILTQFRHSSNPEFCVDSSDSLSLTQVSSVITPEAACDALAVTASLPAATPMDDDEPTVVYSADSFSITLENLDIVPSPQARTTLPVPQAQTDIIIASLHEEEASDEGGNLPVMNSIQLARQHLPYARRSNRSPVVAILLTAAAAAIGISLFLNRSSLDGLLHHIGAPTDSSDEQGVAGQTPIQNPVDPMPIPAEAEPQTREDAQPPEAAMEAITIALENLPPQAYVTLNGRRAEPPLQVLRSDNPLALHAFIGDRVIFTTTLLPTENQTVTIPDVAGKLKHGNRRKTTIDGTPSESSPDTGRTSGTLSSNPYQLRKNPFSTGE